MSQQSQRKKKKHLPRVRIPSNDFVVTDAAGEEYYPHAAEWVEVTPRITVGDIRRLRAMSTLVGDELVDAMVGEAVPILSRLVVAWSWTGMNEEALPQPHRNMEAFDCLDVDELNYLFIIVGQVRGAGKN